MRILTIALLILSISAGLVNAQYTSSGSIITGNNTFVTMDIGVASPTRSTKTFDMNDSWENALGVKSGMYFGMSHNSKLFNVSILGIGFYGQFGMQMNGMNKQYVDYGYELNGMLDNLRIEYEIGPSLSFSLTDKMAIDTYFKFGFAWISAPYLLNDNYEYSVDLGDSFCFAYGVGAKFRYSLLVLSIDGNPGKASFNGDYSEKLPISNVRFLFGVDLLALRRM